jgi:cytochrome c-type biogenesis protein CcmE
VSVATSQVGDDAAPVGPTRTPPRARGRLVLVCLLIAAGVGLLLYKGLLSSLDYFDTVDQALAHRVQIGTSVIRLEGTVVRGTVVGADGVTDFALAGQDGRRVQVVNTGTPPQLFQPCIGVIVVGRFTSTTSSTFDSDQILVKHTAVYVAQHPGRVRDAACSEG